MCVCVCVGATSRIFVLNQQARQASFVGRYGSTRMLVVELCTWSGESFSSNEDYKMIVKRVAPKVCTVQSTSTRGF